MKTHLKRNRQTNSLGSKQLPQEKQLDPYGSKRSTGHDLAHEKSQSKIRLA